MAAHLSSRKPKIADSNAGPYYNFFPSCFDPCGHAGYKLNRRNNITVFFFYLKNANLLKLNGPFLSIAIPQSWSNPSSLKLLMEEVTWLWKYKALVSRNSIPENPVWDPSYNSVFCHGHDGLNWPQLIKTLAFLK